MNAEPVTRSKVIYSDPVFFDVQIERDGETLKLSQAGQAGRPEMLINRHMVRQFFDCLLGAAADTYEERDRLRTGERA